MLRLTAVLENRRTQENNRRREEMKEMLSREQILSKVGALKREEHEIEEWGGTVLLRELTGAERDRMEGLLLRGKQNLNFTGARAQMLMLSCVNENGSPVFTEKDLPMLSELSGKTLDGVFKKVSEMSGMSPGSEGEMEKNSEAIQTDTLGSQSPAF